MTEDPDPMIAIKAEVKRKYEIFDAKRQKLQKAYHNSSSPTMRLRMLAACMRHHYEYMASNILMHGWQIEAIADFADAVEEISKDKGVS